MNTDSAMLHDWSDSDARTVNALFRPDAAQALLAGDPCRAETLLHQWIAESIEALPQIYTKALHPGAITAEEQVRADQLADFRVPLQDGSSIAMGLPYNWTLGVADKYVGTSAPWYIVPRIAFSGALVRAYHATNSEEYADALHDYVMDYVSRYWQDSANLPPKENWLCTACRCGTWHCDRFPGILAALANRQIAARFNLRELLQVWRAITNMMAGLPSNLALGSNWPVPQLTNLFTQGYVWRFRKASDHWLATAVNGLNEAFEIQFAGDGSHEELCSHYGAGTWQVFAAYFALSQEAPDIGLAFDRGKMERAAEYYLSSCTPFGTLAAIGDDYASRDPEALQRDARSVPAGQPPRFTPIIRRAAHWLEPMGIRAAKFIAKGEPLPTWQTRRHPDSGYMFMRDGWSTHSLFANINIGHYSNCHCHYGLLGIQTAGYGREFVVDPGCSALDERPINANMSRTRAHSTLTLAGFDQHVTAPATTTRCVVGDHYDFVVGVYQGGFRAGNSYGPGTTNAFDYQTSIPAAHFRHFLFVKGSYWIVFDALTARTGLTVETRFQFLPTAMTPTKCPEGYVTGWQESNCALLALHWDGWRHQIHTGDHDPIEGWIPHPGGDCIPAPVYKATHPTANAPVWHGTMLWPFHSASIPPVTVTRLPVGDTGFAYRIETEQFLDLFFISNSWKPEGITLDGIETDAPLVHIRRERSRGTRGLACEASYLRIDGSCVFERPGTMLAHEFDLLSGNVRPITSWV